MSGAFGNVRGLISNPVSGLVSGSGGGLYIPSSSDLLSSFGGRMVLPTASGVIADSRPVLTGTSGRTAQPGRCYDFDGINDYILGPVVSSVTGEITISLWAKSSVADGYWFMSNRDGSGNGFDLSVNLNGALSYYSAANGIVVSGNGLFQFDGSWQHVVLSLSSSHINFYVNGVERYSVATVSTVVSSARNVYVGRYSPSALGYWDGAMWDIRLINDAITADQVLELYQLGSLGLNNEDHVLRYTCEDQNPILALDSSGNGRHGTKTGHDAAVGQFHYEGSDLPKDTSENQRGWSGYTYFDGTDDYLKTGVTSVNADDRTISCDLFVNTSANGSIMSNRPSLHGWGFRVVGGGYLQYYHTGGTLLGSAAGVVQSNTWHRVVLTKTGNNVVVTVDGTEVINGTIASNGTDSSQDAWVGMESAGTSSPLKGYLRNLTYIENGTTYTFPGTSADQDGWPECTLVGPVTGRVPAASATTDAIAGSLTYSGTGPKDAKATEAHCGNLDGTDDYIAFLGNTDSSGQFLTVSLEAQNDIGSISPAETLAHQWDSGANKRQWQIEINFEEKVLIFFGSGSVTAGVWKSTNPITINQANAYAFQFNGANSTLKVFLNGEELPGGFISGGVPASLPSTPQPVFLGSAGLGIANWWDGRIWNARIYKGTSAPLTDAQIYDLHTKHDIATPSGQELIFHCPLSEGPGSPVVHDVAGGLIGEIKNADISVGGTFWGSTQDLYHHNLSEGYLNAARFDGVDDYLNTGLAMTGWEELTIWHRSMYLSKTLWGLDGFSDTGPDIRLGHGLSVSWLHYNAGGADEIVAGDWLPNFVWQTLSMAIERGVGGSVYVNNTEVDTTVAWVDPITTSRTFFIGAESGGGGGTAQWFSNRFCLEYRIYDKKLTASEIEWLNTNGKSGTNPGTENLKRHYDFTQGHLFDLSPEQAGKAALIGATEEEELFSSRIPRAAVTFNSGESAIDLSGRPPVAIHNGAESHIDFKGGIAFPEETLPENIILPVSTTNWLSVRATLASTEEVSFSGRKAWKLTEDGTAASTHPMYRNTNTIGNLIDGQPYTLTAIAKAGTRSWITVSGNGVGWIAARGSFFDLINGTVGSTYGSEVLGSTIEHLGDGVYKCSVTLLGQSANQGGIQIELAVSDGVRIYDGDGSSYAYIFDAQMQRDADLGYSPWDAGSTGVLDQDWEFANVPANPTFMRHVSDGNGNILKVDRYLHLDKYLLGSDLESVEKYVKDPLGLLYDDFGRANASSAGSRWVHRSNVVAPIVSGEWDGLGTVNDRVLFAPRQLQTENQEVELEVASWSASHGSGVIVCADDSNVNSGYIFYVSNSATNTYQLFVINNGTLSAHTVVNATAPTAPFVMKARIVGGVMTGYINGVQVISATVNGTHDHTSNRYVGVNLQHPIVDNFKARDI